MNGSLLNVRLLLRDLWSQKLRTLLTMFGIVWGTVAISLLLAFGQGFHRQTVKSMAGLGDGIVICWPSRTSVAWEGLGKGRQIRLTEDDMQLLREQAQTLGSISGEYSDNLLVNYRDKTLRVDVSGVAPVFGEMRNLVPAAGGRFLDDLDWAGRRRMVFVGDKLAGELFGGAEAAQRAVGAQIRLNGSPFTVVGILRKKLQDSSYTGRDEGKMFIPGTTFVALTGARYVDNFIVKAGAGSSSEPLKKEVLGILGRKHHFSPDDREAVATWDTTDNMKFLNTFMGAFRLFLGIIGLLTLVVGGIGVSNIMNVVVEERTREIGIKLALGARPRAIMIHFLVETLFITALGGAVGIVLSAGICALFPLLGLTDYVGTPSVGGWIGAFSAAGLGLVGLVAGWFPARSAARLDPVVAMKA